MDQVLPRVIDLIELELEFQQVLHPQLHGGEHVAGPLVFAAALGNSRAFGGNQFVEHGIVAGKTLVQFLVVALVGNVDGGDQVDPDIRRIGRGGAKTHDGRLQANRPILGVVNDPQVLRTILRRLRGRLGG